MAPEIAPWLQPLLVQYAARLNAGRLHHGILLSGPQGIGVTPFSLELAGRILCQQPASHTRCGQCQSCLLFDAGTHPDFHVIESEKQIGVDQIREGIQALASTAQLSGNKVLVLKRADTLTEAAANALLKTLEEPTASTYLLLTAEKPTQLLSTILSRCEKTALPLPTREQTADWLDHQQSEHIAPLLLHLYAQQPYTLLNVLNEDEKQSPLTFFSALKSMIESEDNVSQLAEKWQAQAINCVEWLMSFARLTTSAQPEIDDINWSFYQQCIEAKQKLGNPGVNKTLVLYPLLAFLNQHPSLLPEESHFAG